MTDKQESLRRTFDTTAELYDAARPAYPEGVFDDVVALAGVKPSDSDFSSIS